MLRGHGRSLGADRTTSRGRRDAFSGKGSGWNTQVRGRRRDGPVRLADVPGGDQEVRPGPRVQLDLALFATTQQVEPQRPEPALEVRDKGEGGLGQDPLGPWHQAAPELHTGCAGGAHMNPGIIRATPRSNHSGASATRPICPMPYAQ
jgi:hypothetical protein